MWAFLLLVGCAALAGTTTGAVYQIRVERAASPASPPKNNGRPSQPAPQPQPTRPAVRPPSGPQIQPPKPPTRPQVQPPKPPTRPQVQPPKPPTRPQVQPPKPNNRPGRSPQTRDVPLTRPAPLPYLPQPQISPVHPIAPAPLDPGFSRPTGNIRRVRQAYDEPSFVQLSPAFGSCLEGQVLDAEGNCRQLW